MPERSEGSAPHADILAAFQRLVGDPSAPEALGEDARAWLRDAGLSEGDAEAVARQPLERVLLYRELVRGGIEAAIRKQIPRTAARLDGAFGRWVARYCDEELPRSHYLRDVPFEFVAWAASEWASSTRARGDLAPPPWLADLARHELCAFDVAGAPPSSIAHRSTEMTLDRPLAFHSSTRLARYGYAVHRLEADTEARDEPLAAPTQLLAYRDGDHDVRYLEVSPLAAAILERLLQARTLRDALAEACDAEGRALGDDVLSGTAELLADLSERGVLLGEREAS